jgi:protein AbiQ
LTSVKRGEPYRRSGNFTRGEPYRRSGNFTRGESYRISGIFKNNGCVVSGTAFILMILRGDWQLNGNLKLYEIDMKYVRDLAKADDNVMSVSPQLNKSSRPFVGILVLVNGHKYCVPLSSPKPKFENKKNSVDFMKILDETRKNENGANVSIGALNFNNMLPVAECFLAEINVKIRKNDTPRTINHKKLLTKQLDWCQKNETEILNKANKLYRLVTQYPEQNRHLTRRCCDFKKLETVLEKRLLTV